MIFVARLFTLLLAFATAPIVARAVGPDGRGLATSGLAVMAIVPVVLAWGVPFAVRRSEAFGRGDSALRSARLLAAAAVVPAAIIGWITTVVVLPDLDDLSRLCLAAGVAVCPSFISVLCDQSVLISRERYARVALLQSASPVINAFSIIGLWLLDTVTVPAVFLSFAFGQIVSFGTGLALTHVSVFGKRDRVAGLLAEGTRYAPGQIAEIATVRLDQVLAVPIAGAVQAGYYAVASTLATLPLGLAHAIGAAVFKRIAASEASEALRVKAQGIRAGIVLGTQAALVMLVVFPWGVPLLFGPEFSGAVPAAMVSAIGTPFAITAYVGTQALAAEGRVAALTAAQIAGLVVGISSLFVLGHNYGALGASAASGLGYLCTMTWALMRLEIPWRQIVPVPSDIRGSWSLLFDKG